MSKDEGKHLLDKLLSVSWQRNAPSKAFQQDDLRPYIDQKLWPGENYLLAGHSYFSQYRIIGTNLETRRKGFLAVLCDRGNRFHCVTLSEALSFDGFEDILDEDERHWLSSLPTDTLIGPAYDNYGKRIPTAFAIWRTVEKDAPVHLEIARR